MPKKYELSVVLPMYRPKEGWENSLRENINLLNLEFNFSIDIEFIIVNDGFETEALFNSFDVMHEYNKNIRFISYPKNMGKGYALRTGVSAATAHTVITTDFDFPYEMKDMKSLYELLIRGNEIVAGKRKSAYYNATPLKRKLISKVCIAMNRHLLKLSLADAQSGLKGFNRKGKALFLQTKINRFLVDTEFLVLALKEKVNVAVLEINLKSNITFSTMGWKILLTEGKNFYRILKMNRKRFASIKVQEYAQQADFVNV